MTCKPDCSKHREHKCGRCLQPVIESTPRFEGQRTVWIHEDSRSLFCYARGHAKAKGVEGS